MRLVLASRSPRRSDLLQKAGFVFETRPVDVDETLLPNEAPRALAERLARQKAKAVAVVAEAPCIVLAADTIVALGGTVLGKPLDAGDAERMLALLRGATHEVVTGYSALILPQGELRAGSEVTRVTFRRITEWEIRDYVRTGEPLDKAGAYAVQGGARHFVAAIEGSYTNVVGLPMEVVGPLLRNLMFPVPGR